MSAKNRDEHNRWRNITVGFRVSPEENEQINAAVALSGLPGALRPAKAGILLSPVHKPGYRGPGQSESV